jgi:hypothetical protein
MGWGATEIRWAADAGDKSTVFEVGSTTQTCQRWTISGIRYSNSLNSAALTGAEATIWIRNSVQGEVVRNAFVGMPKILEVGDVTNETQARRTWFSYNNLSPTLADCPIIDLRAYTVMFMDGNYGGSGAPPSFAISNITQANPAVVTYIGSPDPTNGKTMQVTGVSGMTEINGLTGTVANLNTGLRTFELTGIDSTGFTLFTAGVSAPVTGITAEDPPVVTYSGADVFTKNRAAVIVGASGMTEINDLPGVISGIDTGANTLALLDIDATTFTAWTSGGTLYSNFGTATEVYPLARAIRIKPGATGCDGLYIAGGELNFNNADLYYELEIDMDDQGASNIHITGGCLDGGAIANVYVNLPAGGGRTSRLHNLKLTGVRMASNASGTIGVGKLLKVVSGTDNLISGVAVTGCTISGSGAFIGTRVSGAIDGLWDITFTGNTIINADDVNGGSVFETDTGGLVITGNNVAHQTADNTNRFEFFYKATSAGNGKNVVIIGNNLNEISDVTGFDLSVWNSTGLELTKIRNNAGKSDPAIRRLSGATKTTDATVTTIGTFTLSDNYTYRYRGRVNAIETDGSNRAAYEFDILASASGGTATIASGGTFTTVYESSAAWDCAGSASSNTVRIRVTGDVATDIHWSLYVDSIEVIA